MRSLTPVRHPVFLIGLLFLMACPDSNAPSTTKSKTNPQAIVEKVKKNPEPEAHIEQGDIAALQSRGKLRILVPKRRDSWLPREGHPQGIEQELAAQFARSIQLEPVLVYVKNFEELIPLLIEGKGDLIAANLTVTENRKRLIAFTVPVGHSREQVITHAEDRSIKLPSD